MCYQPFAVFDHSSEKLHLQMIDLIVYSHNEFIRSSGGISFNYLFWFLLFVINCFVVLIILVVSFCVQLVLEGYDYASIIILRLCILFQVMIAVSNTICSHAHTQQRLSIPSITTFG